MSPKILIPVASTHIAAGFPSPGDDYIESRIDLNEELIRNPISTFFLRVKGESMSAAGILDGDLLIVDRSLEPRPGSIVVAILDGSFTLKKLTYKDEIPYLEAEHPDYPAIDLRNYGNIQIWGVAIYSIHSLKNGKKA